jgi:hypothetical protein
VLSKPTGILNTTLVLRYFAMQWILLSIAAHFSLLQVQVVQPSPRAALSGSQRIQAMMEVRWV